MQTYDVIVCGAGPAGATAAATAARAGLRVALLEKQRLPRHKTCGGGMPMAVGEALRDLAPEAFVESDVRFMRHTWKFGDAHLAPMNLPDSERELSLWMVQRSIFDNALAQHAAAAGAELRDGLTVRQIETRADGVTVRAESNGNEGAFVATAPYLIGADGANGVAARFAGVRRERVLAIALEVEHPHTYGTGHETLRQEVIHLEYGAVPRGYAWVFPKGDHLNVGAGVFRPRREQGRGDSSVRGELQQAITDYMDSLGVAYERDRLHFYAHPLPLWNGKERVQSADNRILLAGDAAGLINPLFGDGIYHALRSGIIAGTCVAENAAPDYTRRIHAEFAANFDAALKLAGFFYQFSGFVYKNMVRRPGATRTAARLLSGDAVFTDVTGRVMRRMKRAMIGTSGAE